MTGEPLRVRRGARITRILNVSLLLSLGAAGLSGCYVVSPYASPAYAPTYPPAPSYIPPSAPAPGAPRPGGPAMAPPPAGGSPSQTPGARGVPQGSAQNCQTVTVEGHAETLVRQNGQRETVWVPTHGQPVCQ
jgi:hypothetical protein